MVNQRIFSPHAPVSITRPIMRQTWRNLTFLHWRYDADIVRRTLPPQLTLDTFEGDAWVGLAPFVLAGVSPFGLPATPWISEFPETNVRTYVIGPDGEPGVWFYTLEADRLLAVLAARAWYKLPYRWSSMRTVVSDQTVHYESRRHAIDGRGQTDLTVEAGDMTKAQDFDHFLTARYRLYTVRKNRVAYGQIDHEPWPLQNGKVVRLEEDLIANSGIPAPVGEPIVHFCRELQVRVAPLRWF